MSIESASIVAIIVGAIAALASIVYAFVRSFGIRSRLRRISDSPSVIAASRLPAQGERIASGMQRLESLGGRWDDAVERLTAARDASDRFREGIASVAACVVDLLETFVPSLRGSAS